MKEKNFSYIAPVEIVAVMRAVLGECHKSKKFIPKFKVGEFIQARRRATNMLRPMERLLKS